MIVLRSALCHYPTKNLNYLEKIGRKAATNAFETNQKRFFVKPLLCSKEETLHALTSSPSSGGYQQDYTKLYHQSEAIRLLCRGLSSATNPKSNQQQSLDDKDERKLSNSQIAKKLWNQYGYVFLGTYLSVYVLTLTSLFLGIDSGFIDPSYFLDNGESAAEAVAKDEAESAMPTPAGTAKIVIAKLEQFEIMRPYIPKIENNPTLLNLGVAWICK